MKKPRVTVALVCGIVFGLAFFSVSPIQADEYPFLDPEIISGTITLPDSTLLDFQKQNVPVLLAGTTCDYDWWYGCSPTSAGMMMGYYDLNGYDPGTGRLYYPNVVPGGPAEAETYVGPPTGWSALANSAIASAGHVADFYVSGDGGSGDDVPPPWHQFDCLADFMGTSQDANGSSNGSTTFWTWNDGHPLYAKDIYGFGPSYYDASGMFGVFEYIQHSGYYGAQNPATCDLLYNQPIDALQLTYGFTFAQYKAEIDAGRPVLIHVEGHTMLGLGYDEAAGPTVELYDTWSTGPHSMPWGGSYSGMPHRSVTVVEMSGGIVPEPSTLAMVCIAAGLVLAGCVRRRRR